MKQTEIGRLALRADGDYWNAYWVPSQDSMTDAVHLGSIRMNFVEEHKERKDAFMVLMMECFADQVEEKFDVRPSWSGPRQAPDNERSGSA